MFAVPNRPFDSDTDSDTDSELAGLVLLSLTVPPMSLEASGGRRPERVEGSPEAGDKLKYRHSPTSGDPSIRFARFQRHRWDCQSEEDQTRQLAIGIAIEWPDWHGAHR